MRSGKRYRTFRFSSLFICLRGGGVLDVVNPSTLLLKKIIPDRQRYTLFKIQNNTKQRFYQFSTFVIAAYSVGKSMWVIRYFICASNIVETPFTSDVWNNTRSHCTKRLCNWTPSPWEKLDPWKCWTVLLHGISESYSLKIVFFEKAIITGLPLQNKLRTNKKRRK